MAGDVTPEQFSQFCKKTRIFQVLLYRRRNWWTISPPPPPPAMAHTHETIGNPLRWDFSWPSWGHRSWTSDNWQRCVISSEPGNTPLMFPLMTFRHIGSGLRFTVTTSRWRCRSCMHSKRKPRFHCQRNSNSTKQAYQEKLLAESWIRHFGQKTLGLLFLWCLAHKGL